MTISRWAIPLVVLLGLLRASAGSQQAADSASILQRAIAQHQAGDLDGAIRSYREYLAADPDSVQARSNLGAALARAGRYEEAIAEYNRALSKNAENPALLLNLGLAYYKTGHPAEAAARFELAGSLAPQFKDQVTLLLASCYNSLGKYKQAIALLAPLEKEKTGDSAYEYLYGTALVEDGQNARGEAIIDGILSRGDSAEARLLRATLKLRANDHDAAVAEVEKAIALNPKLPERTRVWGKFYLRWGRSIGRARHSRRNWRWILTTSFRTWIWGYWRSRIRTIWKLAGISNGLCGRVRTMRGCDTRSPM